MVDKRNYKVKGKKMLPKPYNLRHNQRIKLARSLRRAETGG